MCFTEHGTKQCALSQMILILGHMWCVVFFFIFPFMMSFERSLMNKSFLFANQSCHVFFIPSLMLWSGFPASEKLVLICAVILVVRLMFYRKWLFWGGNMSLISSFPQFLPQLLKVSDFSWVPGRWSGTIGGRSGREAIVRNVSAAKVFLML